MRHLGSLTKPIGLRLRIQVGIRIGSRPEINAKAQPKSGGDGNDIVPEYSQQPKQSPYPRPELREFLLMAVRSLGTMSDLVLTGS